MGLGLNSWLDGLGVATLCAGLMACGSGPLRNADAAEAERAASARILSETASRVAVSKVGAKVCRSLTVGISERDWLKGVVVEVSADKVHIRIDDPGRFPQTFDGVLLAPGTVVWDAPTNWTPCV